MNDITKIILKLRKLTNKEGNMLIDKLISELVDELNKLSIILKQ